jgi:hypothetical protein
MVTESPAGAAAGAAAAGAAAGAAALGSSFLLQAIRVRAIAAAVADSFKVCFIERFSKLMSETEKIP